MKKIINALICAMMVLGLSGCGSSGNEKESNVKENDKSTEKLPLEIVQSGYFDTESPNVMYGVIIKNPNTEYTVDFPTITITMYKEDGSIFRN